ncbi:hypothetical protein POM88_037367 [Heracleum sosnowskyi]|uniref:F-box associated beta-propeller type 1 domain-containing protein n=1 Tax=Heracleum sosnowskyi TaxID=360622 RepID=A0AAD8HSF4_9APIA|nr:hypothetical protein POM88_037367 [Heracleum sosnowskyi]
MDASTNQKSFLKPHEDPARRNGIESLPVEIPQESQPHVFTAQISKLHFVELPGSLCDNETVCEVNIPFRTVMPVKVYIYNPFTGKYKKLSKSKQFQKQTIEEVYTCGFPSYPHSEVQICDIVSNTWRSIGSIPWHSRRHSTGHFGSPQNIFCLNGRLYWLVGSEEQYGVININCIPRIISFNLSDEQFLEVNKPACGSLNKHNNLLLALGECLSAAVYSNDGKVEMWIMKEYNVNVGPKPIRK